MSTNQQEPQRAKSPQGKFSTNQRQASKASINQANCIMEFCWWNEVSSAFFSDGLVLRLLFGIGVTTMGPGKRISSALRCLLSILVHGKIPEDIARELVKTPTGPQADVHISEVRATEAENKPSESFDRAVQILALLQRDGRLIDFLAEDVSPYPDAQLGAAVRSVHESSRQVLERYVKLEPIIASDEDCPITLQAGFDAGSIKVVGNTTGRPPLRGLLRHRGWRATQVNLPSLPDGAGRSVVAPAEVEIP
jgi:hypothetical protein